MQNIGVDVNGYRCCKVILLMFCLFFIFSVETTSVILLLAVSFCELSNLCIQEVLTEI